MGSNKIVRKRFKRTFPKCALHVKHFSYNIIENGHYCPPTYEVHINTLPKTTYLLIGRTEIQVKLTQGYPLRDTFIFGIID